MTIEAVNTKDLETRLRCVHHEFPSITALGQKLVMDPKGREFIASVGILPRDVREDIDDKYTEVVGVSLVYDLFNWLSDFGLSLGDALFEDDYKYIDHLLGLD